MSGCAVNTSRQLVDRAETCITLWYSLSVTCQLLPYWVQRCGKVLTGSRAHGSMCSVLLSMFMTEAKRLCKSPCPFIAILMAVHSLWDDSELA